VAARARQAAGLPPTDQDEKDEEDSEIDAEFDITDDCDSDDYPNSLSYSDW
jgi:hypothetical protein